MIELLKRYDISVKRDWMLYIEQEDGETLKKFKKLFKHLPLGLYFDMKNNLIGYHWYGPYTLFRKVLKNYKHSVRV